MEEETAGTVFDGIAKVNDVINTFVWVKIGIIILIGAGILMTIATKFFQVSHLKLWWNHTIGSMFKKNVISHDFKDKKSISPFQALCTALAATVGTGNIAGVAAAICLGGPGAVFWMWLAAFFGMMTNYSENILGIYFRRRNSNGEWSGGAMYYLEDGLGGYKTKSASINKVIKVVGKVLAILFSCFAILASFGIGSMGQVNKIVSNVVDAFPISSISTTTYSIILGVALMALAALIVLGGLKRIASFAEKIVPFMVIFFMLGAFVVIGVHYENILPAFGAIFSNAFSTKAFGGGVTGVFIARVVTQGCKRGVFSNEAGLGSSVMVHSNSTVKEPVTQGMWGIFEVFADTIIVCTITALVVLTSGLYSDAILQLPAEEASDISATLVANAFNDVFPWFDIGKRFVAIAMFLFAFTTVLGWSHYGTKAWEYLFGTKSTIVFKIIHIITILFGAILTSSLAWDISDTFNGLMMIPNLIGVIALVPLVAKLTKNYIDRHIKGLDIKPLLSFDEKTQAKMEEELENDPD